MFFFFSQAGVLGTWTTILGVPQRKKKSLRNTLTYYQLYPKNKVAIISANKMTTLYTLCIHLSCPNKQKYNDTSRTAKQQRRLNTHRPLLLKFYTHGTKNGVLAFLKLNFTAYVKHKTNTSSLAPFSSDTRFSLHRKSHFTPIKIRWRTIGYKTTRWTRSDIHINQKTARHKGHK